MKLNAVNPEVISDLRRLIAPECFRDLAPRYLQEPRGLFFSRASAVVAPGTTAEVAAIVRTCAFHRVGIVPYGGGTGLVGGQICPDIPAPLVLSLERMNKIHEVDSRDKVVIAQAGVILADLRRVVAIEGLEFGLSLASEGTCQIGGNLATNAGGTGVLKFGSARNLCLGLEAVLPDGSIWNGLRRLRKDNTGYDLRSLLIGAEGSLGVITAACLKLGPLPRDRLAIFATIPTLEAALDILNLFQEGFGNLVGAFELIHRQGFEFMQEKLPGVRLPFASPSEWMVFVDLGAQDDANLGQRVEKTLLRAFETNLVTDALVSQNSVQRQQFWAVRETIPEANRLIGAISSHDISVPVGHIPEFVEQAGIAVARFGDLRVNCFGHLGDGNLHYNVFPPKGRVRAEFADLRVPLKDAVFDVVDAFGGSISAEHGIGRLKVGDLQRYGDPAKLAAMRAIKKALDPAGIMNPGAVVP